MLKLSSAEFIDTFSEYFLKSKFFERINDSVYAQCLNTILMVSFATESKTLGLITIGKKKENQFDLPDKQTIDSYLDFAKRRFGKSNNDWIYKWMFEYVLVNGKL